MITIAPLPRPVAFRAPLHGDFPLSVRSGRVRVCPEACLHGPPRNSLHWSVRATVVVAVLLACSAAIPSEAQAHQAALLERGCMVMTTALGWESLPAVADKTGCLQLTWCSDFDQHALILVQRRSEPRAHHRQH